MREGWAADDYLILFPDSDVATATGRYQMNRFLPGYVVTGLKGWDDLLVRDGAGNTYTVPSVPLVPRLLDRYAIPRNVSLEFDARFAGRIKWYIKPVYFGGDPRTGDNLTWVTHEQHGKLVVLWNDLFQNTDDEGGA